MQVRMLVTAAERESVFLHRYEIYVREMGRTQHHADHTSRRVEEPLDRDGVLFGAFSDGRLIGSVRTNFARDHGASEYDSLYELASAGAAYPTSVSFTTKLMVAREHRRGAAAVALAMALFRHNVLRGVTHDFIDCNDHLLLFFEGLGYRRHRPPIEHPEYGRVNPLLLLTQDVGHLEAVGSPFVRLFRKSEVSRVAELARGVA